MKIITICGGLKFQKEIMIKSQKIALYCDFTPIYLVLENIKIIKEQL